MAESLQSANVPLNREAYSLNWLGKSYARYLRDCPPQTLLAEDATHNQQAQNRHSQNLLIKGDNLEVLKHLKNAYQNQVKMIYIDPPYNTGSDGFVYQDDRKFSPEQLAELATMSIEEAKRVLDFTAKKSNSHSAWLTFMYPRLYVARQLLKDDGVIFISIDDNEQAQLKLLCDEVFGEENFVGEIAWQKIHSTKNDAKYFSNSHEYIFCYAKIISNIEIKLLPRTEKMNARFSNPDNDPRGVWSSGDLIANEERSSGYFDVISPNGQVFNVPKGKHWVYSQENLEKLIQENRIWFGKNGTAFPRLKRFLSEVQQGKKADTLWFSEYFGNNQEAKREIKKLFNDISLFDTPKPVRLITQILRLSSNSNDLIMDFFAGSGTTAHAVMQLNAEDGGNRQFICVQLPEETDKKSEAYKAGYCTIFDITQARIEKSAVKIRQDFPDFNGDLGFQIFETVPDFRALADDDFQPQQELPTVGELSDEQYRTLLTTWRLYDGNPLTTPLQAVSLGDYFANWCGNTLYIVQAGFDSRAIKALLHKLDQDNHFLPERIVLFGDNVDSAKQKELQQALHSYTNRKKLNISLLVRY
ncbi:type III restriction endonuclease subunit M [Pasteurellaceae bacterium Orientalotternb1]|nr:type III restriction endonuclease subunit M [Pasteurellaceae bacterium Orientalotternb1]